MTAAAYNAAMFVRRRSATLVPLLLALATIIVAINAWIAYRAVNSLVTNEFWVQHTWHVISQVELLVSQASDAGANVRGYTMLSDPRYLANLHRAQRQLPGTFDELNRLIGDNAPQRDRVEEIRTLVNRRLDLLQQAANAPRPNRTDAFGIDFLVKNKDVMDRLRGIADDMETEEHRLLAQRLRETHRSTVRTRVTLGLASGLDFLLIVLMFQSFVHERALRLETEDIAGRLDVARAEAEESARHVSELNASLEERVRERTVELEATNRELEAFSYSVSHDLRAPLRTVDGFSLALEEDYAGVIDETGRDYIRRVRTGVQRMGQLIDALLQLSRVTRAELVREDVDVTALARTVAQTLSEENPAKPVAWRIEDGLRAMADAKLLQVALENLLGNAVKFSSKVERPEIDFGFDPEKSAWFVRDNGAGFDMQYAHRLFNAFNRLHGDKDFRGSGIGLATVARVVRRHGGSIWAQSEVNHGATFWFTLR